MINSARVFVYNLLPRNQKSRRRDSCEIGKSIWRMKLRIHLIVIADLFLYF
jgi:hypothetical protein